VTPLGPLLRREVVLGAMRAGGVARIRARLKAALALQRQPLAPLTHARVSLGTPRHALLNVASSAFKNRHDLSTATTRPLGPIVKHLHNDPMVRTSRVAASTTTASGG
jgi:hypothetical protein